MPAVVALLLVEDDTQVVRALARLIRGEFLVELDHAETLDAARQLLGGQAYALIILDRWLENTDVLVWARELRAGGLQTPILVLSGDDVIQLDLSGLAPVAAEEKPFSAADLYAKIRALAPGIPDRGR